MASRDGYETLNSERTLRSPHKTSLSFNKLGRIIHPKQHMQGRFSVSFVATKLRRRTCHACDHNLTPHSFHKLP